MKKVKPVKYAASDYSALELKDAPTMIQVESAPMIRTQIYLDQREYAFVQAEAKRRDEPMAAVIRNLIDEKMELPDDAWTNNPMLEPTVSDPDWKSHEDGGLNHDHYISGSPKKWIKVKGQYVASPPLPDDYYSNRASAEAYDRKIRKLDETR